MKCYQCERPAMWKVGDEEVPLCLDCYAKHSQITQTELENDERWINFLQDEMAASVGMPPIGPRFPPRPKPVVLGGIKMNNINVSNSVIGAINTGFIGVLDQSISALVQSGDSEIASAVKALSEAILQSRDLTESQKRELVESFSVIASEAAAPSDRRRNSVAKALLDSAAKIASLASDMTDVCNKWWPVLAAAFTAANG